MLIHKPAPSNVLAAFESGFPSFLGRSAAEKRSGEEPRIAERVRSSSDATPVYTIGLSHLDAAEIDPLLEPCGWMFLTGASPDPIMAAEVYQPAGGAEPKVVNVSGESHNQKIRKIAKGLETLPETKDTDYELRVLRIPALGIEALWLKADKPRADRVVPFLSLDREVLIGRPYPVADFLKQIAKLRDRTRPDYHKPAVKKERKEKPSKKS